MSLKSVCVFFASILLASLSASLLAPDMKKSSMFIQLLVTPTLLMLVMFVLFSGEPDVTLVCESSVWSSNLYIIFSNPNSSMSSIHNSTGPLPGTTKNLHLTTLSLCLNQAEQMHNGYMSKLLYVFRITELLFVVCNDSTVDCENRNLNIFKCH